MRLFGLWKAALVGACATAAATVVADNVAGDSVALKDLTATEVKMLVSSWGLDNLASHLSADQVDGETLFHAEPGDFDGLGDAATSVGGAGSGNRLAPVRNHHWKKFWRRLSEIREAGDAVVDTSVFAKASSSSSASVAASPAHHRRQLASSSDVPSGILLRGEKTRVSFGAAGDAFLEYNSTGTIGVKADALNVHGTLMVGGEECLCAAPPAACPVGGAAVSAGATAEKMIDTTFWKDMDMTVNVETFSDDDRVLLLCNVNYNPEGDSYWGEVTIFRGTHDLGPLQRMDALNEHNQPANMLFMDHPGMTGTVSYSARGRYVGGVFSVSQGSLERHCIGIRASKGYAERSLALSDLLQVSSTSYVDTGLQVEITTESDDEGVLIAANMNYDADSSGNWGYFTILRDDVETGPWQAIDGLASDNAIANIVYLDNPGAGTHTYKAVAKMAGSTNYFDLSEAGVVRQVSATRVGTNWNQTTLGSKVFITSTSYMSVGLETEITTTFGGQKVLVTVNSNFNPNGDSAAWGWFTIYRDSTDLGPLQIVDHPNEDNRNLNGFVLDAPSTPGTYTYKAMYKMCSSCSKFDINQASKAQIAAVAFEC